MKSLVLKWLEERAAFLKLKSVWLQDDHFLRGKRYRQIKRENQDRVRSWLIIAKGY